MLLEVAKEFVNRRSCGSLAEKLGVDGSQRYVESLEQTYQRISSPELAFRVLTHWKRQKGSRATSAILNRILSLAPDFSNAMLAYRAYIRLRSQPSKFDRGRYTLIHTGWWEERFMGVAVTQETFTNHLGNGQNICCEKSEG